ncbi:MAG: NAD(P)-dependent oxidoreductase [Candidatus Nanopelagicales bacterium]
MRIFLTGATGVVGTRALPALVEAGHQVTAAARSAAKADLVRSLGGAPITVDLFDANAVNAAVVGHEAVIHLATQIPPLSKASRASAWEVNSRLRREASRNLADAARAADATRYVQESIALAYEDGGHRWIDEDAPATLSGFFAPAGAAEAVTQRFTDGGGIGVVLRFAQFYAADSGHVQTFNKIARRGVNPLLGPSEAYSPFVHAEDAGAAVVAALVAPAGVYNVGDDEPLTRKAAGQVIAQAVGKARLRAVPGLLLKLMPGDADALMRSVRLSNQKLRRASGWAPKHSSIRGSWPVT